jgi:tetratricopeptide (TPR) repeat protein
LPVGLHREADQAVWDCCIERLDNHQCHKKGRILVLIDNVQKNLQQWSRDEHDRFRGYLSSEDSFFLIGSAPSVFKEIIDQRAAFHQFFDLHFIGDLNEDEVMELVGKWFKEESRETEFKERRDELSKKIPAVMTLTGGNPRLVLFLCRIATRSTFLEIEGTIKGLLEELREYFVRRFDELADQPRKVLDTLAEMPGPATPKEIAEAARLPIASVNSQLSRLRKNHYVHQVKLKRRRSTRYDISESLFRLWRQTATIGGRQRFRFLADFLRLYYTPEEVLALYKEHAVALTDPSKVDRSTALHHIDETYYFQAAAQGQVRSDIFSTRVKGLLSLGETEWAEQEAAQFVADSLERGDKEAARIAYKTQAEIHLGSGQYRAAARDIVALLETGAIEEALAAAQRFASNRPESATAWVLFGVASAGSGDHPRALEALSKAADLGGDTALLLALRSHSLQVLGRNEEAIKCAEESTSLDPQDAWAWEMLGRAAGNAGEYERALEAFRKATELSGEAAELFTLQSQALGLLGHYEEALEYAEKATSLDPQHTWAWEMLGRAAGDAGDHRRALEAYGKAIDVGGERTDLLALQSKALRSLGRNEEAIKCAEKATSLGPEHTWAWETLGRAAGNAGEYERALEAFRKAADLGGETANLLALQSQALRKLGRLRDALLMLDEALALEPDAPLLLEKAWFLSDLGDTEGALGCIASAEKHGAGLADVHHTRGDILSLAGRFEEAVENLRAGLELQQDSLDLQSDLAIARACLGRSEDLANNLRSHLSAIEMPTDLQSSVCEYIVDIAGRALVRKEIDRFRGLYATILSMKRWHERDWFGVQIGAFLKKVLDTRPDLVPQLVEELERDVQNEVVLRLVDPFIKSVDYLRTEDPTILEKLFPETRNLVLDIARRINPELKEPTRRTGEV